MSTRIRRATAKHIVLAIAWPLVMLLGMAWGLIGLVISTFATPADETRTVAYLALGMAFAAMWTATRGPR
jgi:cytochrome c biogenesis protein CcdA